MADLQGVRWVADRRLICRLRGLPCVAEGVQGAMFDTRPDFETTRKLDR
jgi:hypothetical protein